MSWSISVNPARSSGLKSSRILSRRQGRKPARWERNLERQRSRCGPTKRNPRQPDYFFRPSLSRSISPASSAAFAVRAVWLPQEPSGFPDDFAIPKARHECSPMEKVNAVFQAIDRVVADHVKFLNQLMSFDVRIGLQDFQ